MTDNSPQIGGKGKITGREPMLSTSGHYEKISYEMARAEWEKLHQNEVPPNVMENLELAFMRRIARATIVPSHYWDR